MKKYIPNSKDYYVCTDGFIYKGERKLKGNEHHGYRRVTIFYRDETKKRFYIHRLVSEYFIPNPEDKPMVNHKDSDKSNNKVENLEWCTNQENLRHAAKNGNTSPNYKYSDEVIHKVCSLLEDGLRIKDISELTDVPKGTISMIYAREQWPRISQHYNFKIRNRRISEETARWACNRFEEGFSVDEVFKLSRNPKLTKTVLQRIFDRRYYRSISLNYTF